MFALQVDFTLLSPPPPVEWPLTYHLSAQFAKAAGATVIATTSSAAKASKLKELGADHILNYKEDPNWGETARKLTFSNEGVDHIVEVGGTGTLAQSFKAIKYEGVISVIGFLGGVDPKILRSTVNAAGATSWRAPAEKKSFFSAQNSARSREGDWLSPRAQPD